MMLALGSYGLGLLYIFLVSVIWALASVLVQHIYKDLMFDSPFLVTYVCTSLFLILLPNRWFWNVVSVWRRNGYVRCSEDDRQEHEMFSFTTKDNDKDGTMLEEAGSCSSPIPVRTDVNEIRGEEKEELGHYETLKISAKIAPLWFLSNYCYNLSLDYATVTASTVLASMGSIFTFGLAVRAGIEDFALHKLVGVGLGIAGTALTAVQGGADGTGPSLSAAGLVSGLIGAAGYGAYTVAIKDSCDHSERSRTGDRSKPEVPVVSMQLLFGYLGLLNMVGLAPIAIGVAVRDANEASLSGTILGWLVLKGLLDNVLSDYLWAKAVVLTSATVATVGLSLTIPLAFISDWIVGGIWPTLGSTFGAAFVLVGFVLVNLG